jgi:hypothetical protein
MDPTIAGASEIFFIMPFLWESAARTCAFKIDIPDHLVYTWNTRYQCLTVSIEPKSRLR